jgi:leucine dehydrogenase
MFDHPSFDAHEGVHVFHDAKSGLRAIIAVHSTALGPAAGGCRMWPYADGAAMLTDALRLSQGMSYKNAVAGLDLGGGKAVIWANPRTDKSEALFEAFGEAVESLAGRYYTAEDVGISTADMAIVRRKTAFVAGLPDGLGASGDPSPVTARGVFAGIRAACARAFGTDHLNGRTVAVQGVGHVGGYVCDHLAQAGARLILTDINAELLAEVAGRTGGQVVAPDDIYDVAADVFSPNALGAVVNPATLPRLQVKVIAGGANNQLATPAMGEALAARGILYAPDYVINGGGIINVAAEIRARQAGLGYDRAWVEAKLAALTTTLEQVLDEALREGLPTHVVADRLARARILAGRP